ncbi:hypothetical protein QWZ10_07305 [Paracoccus cavernae]|uniref:Uncharacterized protein n=1 Tax=Paracoccus cavernae TaxID=1571207 RepID=A0ABT8D5D5_9RHOB|nr:hypothetical protein [Paracoccus cavernae]
MTAPQPIPADGQIVLDRASNRQVPAQVMQAELVITLESGPTYSFDVSFELPAIHQPTGLQRRLTNLGLYAGITEFFDGRALWAMRAFKRIHMNRFTRNASARENDQLLDGQAYRIPAEVMEAVRKAHGAHPADRVSELEVPEALLRRAPRARPMQGCSARRCCNAARTTFPAGPTTATPDQTGPRPSGQVARTRASRSRVLATSFALVPITKVRARRRSRTGSTCRSRSICCNSRSSRPASG